MDKIIIGGLKIYAHHGVNTEETELGQWFVLDIVAAVDLTRACTTDSIDDTVSYAAVIKAAKRIMTCQNDLLIERAAQRVADGLLAEFPKINRVQITLRKPDAPVGADIDFAAVQIERGRT